MDDSNTKIRNEYFMPNGYKSNSSNITFDNNENFYWDSERVERSSYFQFAVYQWAKKIISDNNLNTIFDIGCGFAAKLKWLHQNLPHCEMWGIDQPHAVELCEKNYDFGNWLGVDFENDPKKPPISPELIISSDVIEHLENPDHLLNYFKSIANDQTYILISTPERDCLRKEGCLVSPNPYHIREWNKQELAAYLESRGFTIIAHKVLPAMKANLHEFYIKKFVKRLLSAKTMNYNQAVLMKLTGKS